MADQDQTGTTFNTPRLAPSRDGQVRDRDTLRKAAQAERPGRQLGVFSRRVDERGFSFLRDGRGEEYFAHLTGYDDPADFTGLTAGEGVSFRVRETTKGLRAFDIRRATAQEQEVIHGWAEDRGNR